MKLILGAIFCVMWIYAEAQTADSVIRYYDREYKVTDAPQKAKYYGISILKDSVWEESKYYSPTLQLSSYGIYKDKELKIPVDSFYSFHFSGELQGIGNYVNGKKDGIWLKYHSNGSTWDSAKYIDGKPVGTHLSWHANGFPADSIIWTENGGTVFSWNDEGRFQAAGYKNLEEKKQGSWKFYHPNGKISSAEIYNNGELKDIQTFDENGNSTPNQGLDTKLEIESEYPGGIPVWTRYLNRNIRYPRNAVKQEIEGIVVVQFMVDREGNVSNVEAISGPIELREESERLIKISGKWVPSFYHGINVKSYKKQPFVFRLH